MALKRKVNRRSFLAQVAGGGALLGGSLALVAPAARAQVTDRDPTDPVGRGRGGSGDPGRTGITDRDPSDPVGRGRGGGGGYGSRTGITDSDSGPGADPVGRGRGTRSGGAVSQEDQECARELVRISEIEQRLAFLERSWTDEQYSRAVWDAERMRELAGQARAGNDEQRYAAFEQIRQIAARWGLGCGPTDINCQLSGLQQMIEREHSIRLERQNLEPELAQLRRRVQYCR